MTREEMEKLRKNLVLQVKSLKNPPKAFIAIIDGGDITWESVNMGPGETTDRVRDMLDGCIEHVRKREANQ